MREPLTDAQYNAGLEMLDACCKEVGLGRADMAKVLIKLPELKYFYTWNNASDFLCQFLYGPAEPVTCTPEPAVAVLPNGKTPLDSPVIELGSTQYLNTLSDGTVLKAVVKDDLTCDGCFWRLGGKCVKNSYRCPEDLSACDGGYRNDQKNCIWVMVQSF